MKINAIIEVALNQN